MNFHIFTTDLLQSGQIDVFGGIWLSAPSDGPVSARLPKEPSLKKRLLLAGCVITALAGCAGMAIATAASTAVAPIPGRVLAVTDLHSFAAEPVVPAVVPALTAATPPPVAPITAAATDSPAVAAHMAVPTPAPTHVIPSATPEPQRDLLTGPHGLNTSVGPAYTDCTGTSAVARSSAYIDTCHTTAVLFIGHNHGVFTPLLSFVVGDVINWYDSTGIRHQLRIIAVRDVSSAVFRPRWARMSSRHVGLQRRTARLTGTLTPSRSDSLS